MPSTLGWLIPDRMRASRSNRSRASSSGVIAAGRILTATVRPSRACSARYTAPMPPTPHSAWTFSPGNESDKDSAGGAAQRTTVPATVRATTVRPGFRGSAPGAGVSVSLIRNPSPGRRSGREPRAARRGARASGSGRSGPAR
jgi:hypothetical protein